MDELDDYQNPPGYGEIIGHAQIWQPIEAAPQGRLKGVRYPQVLLIGRYPGNGGWSDVYHGWYAAGGWARWPHHFPPTHWMPLPEPPNVG